MKPEISEKLLALNQTFYNQFAQSFAESRGQPQPGFNKLIDELPVPCHNILDVGCGNGRFGRFIKEFLPGAAYAGVDFSEGLISLARLDIHGEFFQRDISRLGFLEGFKKYDLLVCLATMQHIPGRENRLSLLKEMAAHLSADGRIFLANWQFMGSERQRRKVRNWQEVGILNNELEPNDYLLSWNRDGYGLRYVSLIDESETIGLVEESFLKIVNQFRADGREGNLNLYTIIAH